MPGGTIEFGETPADALKRELQEEVGILVKEYELFDANSVFLIGNTRIQQLMFIILEFFIVF